MATIYGTSHYSYWSKYYVPNDDVLLGTASDDYIDARGGNDTVFAGFGNDTVYGGYGDDYLEAGDGSASVTAWGNDWVSGGDGNDVIDYSRSTSASNLNGDAGDDWIFGSSGGDIVSGGAGDDYLRGNAGSDYMTGGAGSDYTVGGSGNDTLRGDTGIDELNGGTGNDRIIGGVDADLLTGGSGYDTFAYDSSYESGLTSDTSDTITDFNPIYDRFDFAQAGNQFNYTSTFLYSGSDFNTAYDWAAGQIAAGAQYAFATGASDEGVAMGYLFADADGNGTMDTGIEMVGVDIYTFGYGNIV